MPWKVEVIADGTGQWCGNGLRFTTRKEAEDYGWNLSMRWTAVRSMRAVECPAEPEGLEAKS
jgi:hypothetical protein